jgi:hypothetical protein
LYWEGTVWAVYGEDVLIPWALGMAYGGRCVGGCCECQGDATPILLIWGLGDGSLGMLSCVARCGRTAEVEVYLINGAHASI